MSRIILTDRGSFLGKSGEQFRISRKDFRNQLATQGEKIDTVESTTRCSRASPTMAEAFT